MRAFSRKQAFAQGKPYSVVTIGYGCSFVYRDGVLCYLSGNYVRILDVFGSSSQEKVINTRVIEQDVSTLDRAGTVVELLHYNGGLLILRFTHATDARAVPLVIAVETTPAHLDERLISWNPRNLVIRSDSNYIVVATYTGTTMQRGHTHREWQIRYIRRFNGQDLWSRAIQLRNFYGTDLGYAIAFEVLDGYFYAVSNLSTSEVEEVDWTSYYHCWRIKLQGEELPQLQHKRVWRRQHRDGVINDQWTDLNICKDEKTGTVTIVEARREYLDEKSSQSTRTFYLQPLVFDEADDIDLDGLLLYAGLVVAVPKSWNTAPSSTANPAPQISLPANDVLTRTLTKDDKPNFEEVSLSAMNSRAFSWLS